MTGAGTEATRPVTLLIAALGGEGGGVLTDWIVTAARDSGYIIQSTSIPGVAQRTGATTYYVEIWPEPRAALGDRRPVMSLSPAPGEVDVFVSSELMETGRALLNGFVTPERTHLIASLSRVLTIDEKAAMGAGEFDAEALRKAAVERSRDQLLFDMAAAADAAGSPISAVMLGAIAGSSRLPVPTDAFEAAIRAEGKAVEANLRGFRAGADAARVQAAGVAPAKGAASCRAAPAAALAGRVEAFPPAVREIVALGVARLTDYQDPRYAGLYLDRLDRLRNLEGDLLATVARHLAVRMSYEDIIRVAALKTRPERFARIRAETEAGPGDLVRVTEFFKPGLAEVCDVLPAGLARRLLARAARKGGGEGRSWAMEVGSTTVWGFARLRFLAGLRGFRRRTYRWGVEQAAIEAWLDDVAKAAARDPALALEIAECARLIKGYGSTHRRGSGNLARIRAALIGPALDGALEPQAAAAAIAQARAAALADPEGETLAKTLAALTREGAALVAAPSEPEPETPPEAAEKPARPRRVA